MPLQPVHLPAARTGPSRRDLLSLAACALACPPLLHAQDYPARPTRLVVPLGAGGSMDPLGRAVAAGLAEGLGQPVVVDNKPGAAGQIGADIVAKSAGDPYNLFLGSMGIMSISPWLYPNLPYDVQRDFTPLALCAEVPYALVVNPTVVPVRSVAELVQWAQAQKNPVAYGSVGSGSVAHVAAVMFGNAARVPMTQVPYRAPAQIATDMVKGDLPMIFDSPTAYMGFAKEGRLRILAVTSRERMPILPEVPTMVEAGLRDFDLVSWFGLYGPRDLPAAVVARLRRHTEQVLRSPKVQEQFTPMGLRITPDGAHDFAAFDARDRARWKTFLERNNIQLDKV